MSCSLPWVIYHTKALVEWQSSPPPRPPGSEAAPASNQSQNTPLSKACCMGGEIPIDNIGLNVYKTACL